MSDNFFVYPDSSVAKNCRFWKSQKTPKIILQTSKLIYIGLAGGCGVVLRGVTEKMSMKTFTDENVRKTCIFLFVAYLRIFKNM